MSPIIIQMTNLAQSIGHFITKDKWPAEYSPFSLTRWVKYSSFAGRDIQSTFVSMTFLSHDSVYYFFDDIWDFQILQKRIFGKKVCKFYFLQNLITKWPP